MFKRKNELEVVHEKQNGSDSEETEKEELNATAVG